LHQRSTFGSYKFKLSLLFSVLLLLFPLFVSSVESFGSYYVTSSNQYFPTGQAYINFADSITPLTFTTLYKQGSASKLYVNSTWIKTTSDLTVNAFFSNDWFNYTTSDGTQQIMHASKPNAVYFNDVSKTEGDGWTYSDNTVTVTPSGTDIAITWGGSSEGPSADSAGEGTPSPSTKLNSMLIIVSLTFVCLTLLWLGETTKRRH